MQGLATPDEMLKLIGIGKVLGLDLETTGLNPGQDKIRLISISDGNQTLVMDCFEHNIRTLFPALTQSTLIAHHAAFDLGFLCEAGLSSWEGLLNWRFPKTICTYLTAQLLTAGEGHNGSGHCGLAACVKRWLNRDLPKELQKSDWSGPLTADQIEYSRRDAEVLIPLLEVMEPLIEKADLKRVRDIEMEALPAFIWMDRSGVPFDQPAWEALEKEAACNKVSLEEKLDRLAPTKGLLGLFGTLDSWNWDSPQQVLKVLELIGYQVDTTNDSQLATLTGELPDLLRQHRHQSQLVKMYGAPWLAAATLRRGRVFPNWRQIGAASGRTSCDKPNMQQLPRDPGYRACIKAPLGRVLIKADYTSLQMRIACNLARDHAMYKVFSSGGDPHTATAQALLGRQKVSKTDRQIAKSANFGLLFGMSAEGLQVYARTTFGVEFSLAEAVKHRTRFFQIYPGLALWHQKTKALKAKETRSLMGRRRLLNEDAPDTWRINSPVQGDEADGLKRALALLWDRRRECPHACPVLAVHDEIVIEAYKGRAEEARQWLVKAMEDGMRPILDPVPVCVESRISESWGE